MLIQTCELQWSRRECCKAVAKESAFARSIGMTRADLLALPPIARALFNVRFLDWCAAEESGS